MSRKLHPDQVLRELTTMAVPFVLARRKKTGGFSATPSLPATVEDTYHALNILGLALQYGAEAADLADIISDITLHTYLESRRKTLPAGARTFFQLLSSCRTAGLELDRDAVEKSVLQRLRTSATLEDWYYYTRILAEVLEKDITRLSEEAHGRNISGGGWRSVDEAWMHLYLSRTTVHADLPMPASELIAWFRDCQNGDGGFGFFPRTTSFVENCHAVLRALAFLGVKPSYPGHALSFLMYCRTKSGGFGRSLRAAPFLDTTWHALAGMECLSRMAFS